jgi:hypothetical protein
MPAIPAFVLKRLYIAGSLRNTDDGCQLQIKNTLAPATITGIGPIIVDGAAVPPEQVVILRNKEPLPANETSARRPLSFDINVVVTLVIKNLTLAAGEHRIGLDVTSREAGRLKWEITDTIA